MVKQIADIICIENILDLKAYYFVSNDKLQIIIIRVKDSKPAISGERIQDKQIWPNFNQDRLLGPTDINPVPNKAPITVWVPDIGIPKNEENIINTKEVRQTENIIIFYSDYVSMFRLGIMSDESVAATLFAQNIEPINSDIAPIITSFFRERAFEPYDVANPFAASFDPIENDIIRLKIITNIIQISIFIFNFLSIYLFLNSYYQNIIKLIY